MPSRPIHNYQIWRGPNLIVDQRNLAPPKGGRDRNPLRLL